MPEKLKKPLRPKFLNCGNLNYRSVILTEIFPAKTLFKALFSSRSSTFIEALLIFRKLAHSLLK